MYDCARHIYILKEAEAEAEQETVATDTDIHILVGYLNLYKYANFSEQQRKWN